MTTGPDDAAVFARDAVTNGADLVVVWGGDGTVNGAASSVAGTGVPLAITSGDGGAEVRDLPYIAGMAAAYGMSPDDALRSVTLWPALRRNSTISPGMPSSRGDTSVKWMLRYRLSSLPSECTVRPCLRAAATIARGELAQGPTSALHDSEHLQSSDEAVACRRPVEAEHMP